MPLRGILTTARTLAYYNRLQELTANNLANVATDGFKLDRMTAHLLPGAGSPVPVQAIDLAQGTLTDTGRPLDLALDGPGFFVVATAGGERLIRGGSLRLDRTGRLVDAHGDPLQGADGPILVTGGTVEISGAGEVVVDGVPAGRLRMVDVDDPGSLRKEGAGRFLATGELRPAAPHTRVRQGALEASNVDTVLGMVDLVTIQRAYAANVDALRAMDGVLETITNQVGKVG